MNKNLITEGQLRGSFKGFKDRDTVFEFVNGQKYQQNEYKYAYHYAYRPYAKVVETMNGLELYVEEINDSVLVKRIR